ncbi:MAG TPA: hypothetical protein VM432_07910, partial [Bdellovibrionales bacterium]|nr:hypothetical protein [Bdellovibrionales bacterium]
TSAKVLPFDPLSGFQYWILPGNCPPDFPHQELHNRAFDQWRVFWTEVMQQVAGERVRTEDFWRQRIISVLTRGNEIAAIHLYSFFNLDSQAALAHSYIRNYYDEADLNHLRSLGVNSVMSMEYLTVNPEFRNRTLGFPIASLLIALGAQIFKASGYDAAVAPCRTDLKVDVRAAELGCQTISESYVYHNFPVINMALLKNRLRPHPDERVNLAIHDLWARRRDISGFPFQTIENQTKKSA